MTVEDITPIFPSFKKNLNRLSVLMEDVDYLRNKNIKKSGVKDTLKTRSEVLLLKVFDPNEEKINKRPEAKIENSSGFGSSFGDSKKEEKQIEELPEIERRTGGSQKNKNVKQVQEKISDTMPDFESDISIHISPEDNYAAEKFTKIIEGYAQKYTEVKETYYDNINRLVSTYSQEKRPELMKNYAGWMANYNFKQWIQQEGFSKTISKLGEFVDILENKGKFDPFDIFDNLNMPNWLSNNPELMKILHSDETYRRAYIESLKSVYDSVAPEMFEGFVKDDKKDILRRAAADLYDLKDEKVNKKLLIQSIRSELEKDYKKEDVDKIMPQVAYYVGKNYNSLGLENYMSSYTPEERQKLVSNFSTSKTLRKVANLQGRKGMNVNDISIDEVDEKSLPIVINEFIAELKLNPEFSKYRKNAEATAAKMFGKNFNKYYNKDLVLAKMQSSPIYIKTLMSSVNTLVNAFNGADDRFGTVLRPKDSRIHMFLNTENINEISESDYKTLKKFAQYHFSKLDNYIKNELNEEQQHNINVKAYQALKKIYDSEAISFVSEKDDRAAVFLDTMLTDSRGLTERERLTGKKFFREGVAFINHPTVDKKKLYVKDVINSPIFLNPHLLQKMVKLSKERSTKEVHTGNFEVLVKEVLPLVTGSYYKVPMDIETEGKYKTPEEAAEYLYLKNPFIKRLQKAASSPEEFKKFLAFMDGAATDLGVDEEGNRLFDRGLLNDDIKEFFTYDETEEYKPSSKYLDVDIKEPSITVLEKEVLKTPMQHERFFEKIKQNPKLINELRPELKDNIEYSLDIYDKFYSKFKEAALKNRRGLDGAEEELNLFRTEIMDYFNYDLQLPKYLFKGKKPFNYFKEVNKIEDPQIKYMVLEANYILETLDEEFYNNVTSDKTKVDNRGINTSDILEPVDWKEIHRKEEESKQPVVREVKPKVDQRQVNNIKKLLEEQITQLATFSPSKGEHVEPIIEKINSLREKYPEIVEEYEDLISEAEEKRIQEYKNFEDIAKKAIVNAASGKGADIPNHIKVFIDDYNRYNEGFKDEMLKLFQFTKFKSMNLPGLDEERFDVLKEKQLMNPSDLLDYLENNVDEAKTELNLDDIQLKDWMTALRENQLVIPEKNKEEQTEEEEIIEDDTDEFVDEELSEEPEGVDFKEQWNNLPIEKRVELLSGIDKKIFDEAELSEFENWIDEHISDKVKENLLKKTPKENDKIKDSLETILNKVILQNDVLTNRELMFLQELEDSGSKVFDITSKDILNKINEQINTDTKEGISSIRKILSIIDNVKKLNDRKLEVKPIDEQIYKYFGSKETKLRDILKTKGKSVKISEKKTEPQMKIKLEDVNSNLKKWNEFEDINDYITNTNKTLNDFKTSNPEEFEKNKNNIYSYIHKVMNVIVPEILPIIERLRNEEETDEDLDKIEKLSKIDEDYKNIFNDVFKEIEDEENGVTEENQEVLNLQTPEKDERQEAKGTRAKYPLIREKGFREERERRKPEEKEPIEDRKTKTTMKKRPILRIKDSGKPEEEKNEEMLDALEISPGRNKDGTFKFKSALNKGEELRDIIERKTKPFDVENISTYLLEELPFQDKDVKNNVRNNKNKAQTLKNLVLSGRILHIDEEPIMISKEEIPERFKKNRRFVKYPVEEDTVKQGQMIPWEFASVRDKQSALLNVLFELSTEKDPTGLMRLKQFLRNDEEYNNFKYIISEVLPGIPVDSELENQGADLEEFRKQHKDAIIPFDFYKKGGVSVDKVKEGSGGDLIATFVPRKSSGIQGEIPDYRFKDVIEEGTRGYLDSGSLSIPKKRFGYDYGKDLLLDSIKNSKFGEYLTKDERIEQQARYKQTKFSEIENVLDFIRSVAKNVNADKKDKQELLDTLNEFEPLYEQWKEGSKLTVEGEQRDKGERKNVIDAYNRNIVDKIEKLFNNNKINRTDFLPYIGNEELYNMFEELKGEQLPFDDPKGFSVSMRDLVDDLFLNKLKDQSLIDAIGRPTILTTVNNILRMEAEDLEKEIDEGNVDLGKKSKENYIRDFIANRRLKVSKEIYDEVVEQSMKKIADVIQLYIVENDIGDESIKEIERVFNELYSAFNRMSEKGTKEKMIEISKLLPGLDFSRSGLSTIRLDIKPMKDKLTSPFLQSDESGSLTSDEIIGTIKELYGDEYESVDKMLSDSKAATTFEVVMTKFVDGIVSEDKNKIASAYNALTKIVGVLKNNGVYTDEMKKVIGDIKKLKEKYIPTEKKKMTVRRTPSVSINEDEGEEEFEV